MGIITTVDEHASKTLLQDWPTVAPAPHAEGICPHCGRSSESDPSVMLGVVLLLVGNTLVIAALVAAVVWILA